MENYQSVKNRCWLVFIPIVQSFKNNCFDTTWPMHIEIAFNGSSKKNVYLFSWEKLYCILCILIFKLGWKKCTVKIDRRIILPELRSIRWKWGQHDLLVPGYSWYWEVHKKLVFRIDKIQNINYLKHTFLYSILHFRL